MHFRRFIVSSVVALAATATTAAYGQATSTRDRGTRQRSLLPYTSYGYVGGAIGRSDYDLGSCAFSCDDTATGLKLFTGGQFSRVFGVELSYVNLGEADRNGGDVRGQGLNLSLLAHLPITDQFKVFGKVGTIYSYTRTRAASGFPSGHDDGFGWSYGAGLQYDINRNWAVRGDWDRYRLEYVDRNDPADFYSVGVVYKF